MQKKQRYVCHFWHISLTCSPVYPMVKWQSVLFYNCIGNKIQNLWINQFLNNYLSCFLSAIKLLLFSRKKMIFIYSISRRDLTQQSLLISPFMFSVLVWEFTQNLMTDSLLYNLFFCVAQFQRLKKKANFQTVFFCTNMYKNNLHYISR